MMKNFKQFITENYSDISLDYYAFDWDDNILMMPTKIHMEKLVGNDWIKKSVSTEEFAKIRTDTVNWRITNDSFSDFRDFGIRGDNAFTDDIKIAIDNNAYGPSWNNFVKCLTKGSVFAIITARGHESGSIRKGVEYIIYNILTEDQINEMNANLYAFKDLFDSGFDMLEEIEFEQLVDSYLDHCEFVGVSSPKFAKKHPDLVDAKSGSANPEKGKRKALSNFVEKINAWGKQTGYNVELGFSDDDIRNVDFINKYFNETKNLYDINFFVIDTSNNGMKKTKI